MVFGLRNIFVKVIKEVVLFINELDVFKIKDEVMILCLIIEIGDIVVDESIFNRLNLVCLIKWK